jgi:type I restriction enzyme, S subunit
LIPPKFIIEQFSGLEKPLFDLIENLLWKNTNLRRTRDLLLPKLISGEIDVSDLDIQITVAET